MTIKTALEQFHTALSGLDSSEDRLSLLVRHAGYVVEMSDKKHVRKYRHIFNKTVRQRFADARDAEDAPCCIVCWRIVQHFHHVIQLKNGGDNRADNIVPLCKACHEKVHPWMTHKPARRPSKPNRTRTHKKQHPLPKKSERRAARIEAWQRAQAALRSVGDKMREEARAHLENK